MQTIVKAAELLGVPAKDGHGRERISGHTLRVTGAQGLAMAGLELWAIQLLGRWGSQSVTRYVRDAHLETVSKDASAKRARFAQLDLDDIVELVCKKLGSTSPGCSSK